MEIWITKSAKTNKATAWFYNFQARRSFRLSMAEAELMLATGEAVQIAKPRHLG